MRKLIGAMGILLLVASCGGGGDRSPAPRNMDDACAILRERPTFLPAFLATQKRWGVPVHVQMATLYQESKFISDARPPFRYTLGVIPMGRLSSAYGYSQALDATWEEYQKATGRPRSRRNTIKDAADFMGWYMNLTKQRNGIPLSDARNQYLAYHEGHTGYSRGSYKRKSWLVRVAGEVGSRAEMYRHQLPFCGRNLRGRG